MTITVGILVALCGYLTVQVVGLLHRVKHLEHRPNCTCHQRRQRVTQTDVAQ